jgi:hypothetical protein
MFPQFIDELLHFECCRDSLNETCPANGAPRHTDSVLCDTEDIIPQSGFKITLHLGEIEIRPRARFNEIVCVVEEVQSKVKDTAADGLRVNEEVLLIEMPSSGTTVRELLFGTYRTMSVASFLSVRSLYCFPLAAVKSICFRIESRRLTCPANI